MNEQTKRNANRNDSAKSPVGKRFVSCLALAGLLIATWSSISRAEGEPARRYRTDAEDVAWMQTRYPEAARRFLEGEALLAHATSRDDVESAVRMFDAAGQAAPQSALAFRRKCQALSALERGDEAVEACRMGLANRSGGIDFRAMVGALMSGVRPPTLSEIGYAAVYARRARELMPDDPWGYAAQCDIAERLGDVEMFNECLNDLRRVAPNHYETRHAEAIAATFRPGPGVVVGWSLIGLLGLGTIAHALFSAVNRKWIRRAHAALLVVCAATTFLARSADAEDTPKGPPPTRAAKAGSLSKYPIDMSDPEGSVPSPEQRDKDPLEYGYFLMDLGDKAIALSKAGDHAGSAKVYRAMAKAVPDMSISFSRLCTEYEAAGDLPKALEACSAALAKSGVKLEDYSHYGRLALAKEGALTPTDVADLDAVVEHLVKDDAGRTIGWEIQCNLGVKLGDVARLEICAPGLASVAPTHPKTTYFQWALALHKKDFKSAERFVAAAKTSTADPVQVQRMETATFEALPLWRRGLRDWRIGAALSVIVFAGLAIWISRRGTGEPVLRT